VLNLTTITGWIVGSINGLNPNILLVNLSNTSFTPKVNTNLPTGITQFYSVISNTKGVQSWITQNVSFPVGTYSLSFYMAGCFTSYNNNNTLSLSINSNSMVSGIIATTDNWTKYNYTFTISTAGTYPLTFYFNNNYANSPNGFNSIIGLTGIEIIGLSSPRNPSFTNVNANGATLNYTVSGTNTTNNELTYYATTLPSTSLFTSTTNSLTLSNLQSNTNYTVQLYAKQTLGGLQSSTITSSLLTPHSAPTAPMNLSLSNLSATSVTLPSTPNTSFVSIAATTNATTTTSGALRVAGGVGVGGDLWVGGEIHGTGLGVPPGTIVMWYGSIATIPSGWGFCDGTTYDDGATPSPDLRNQFIIGASADNEGASKADPITGGAFVKTGGNKDGTLGEHTHSYSGVDQSPSGGTQLGTGTSGWYAHSSLTTSQEGSVLTGANLPPFYSLAYIIKLL
jgi:hypothetical protein